MSKVPSPPTQESLIRAKLADNPYIVQPTDDLHHLYGSKYPAQSFNPGLGSGRFHVFLDSSGNAVPVFYAANTVEGAYCETLFRAVSNGSAARRRVPGKRVSQFSYAKLNSKAPIKLAHLSGDQLARLGITRSALLEPGPNHYKDTTAWAKEIHSTYSDLQGLAWVSRQHDASTCFMFFGDRVSPTDLIPVATVDLSTPSGRAQADLVGMKLLISITR